MIPFSYRVFRDQLSRPLERAETQFMIKTFSGAALYFLLLAIAVGNINIIISNISGNVPFLGTFLSIAGFLLYFPLHVFIVKYRNNPLRFPNSFVVTIFSLLTFSFMFLFLGLCRVITRILTGEGMSNVYVWWVILFIFGASFFIYLIPVSVAFFISHRRTIISLNKFLRFCCIAYFSLFFLSLPLIFLGYGLSGFFGTSMFFLGAAIVFCSPIVTIYRLKTIAPYINFDDPLERKRWEQYFIFEISLQLLHITLYVMRTVFRYLARNNSRCR